MPVSIPVRVPAARAAAVLALVPFVLALAGSRLPAQHAHHDHAAAGNSGSASGHDHGAMAAHLVTTPRRPASAADSARAMRTVVELREAIAKYRDVRVAEADGFEQFAPQLKEQRVHHFTRKRNAVKAAFRFDPAAPTSLLYRRERDGRFVLVGAMYTAPRRATPEQLDARLPLSMAQWHRHVNICLPPKGAPERWREVEDGRMRFGPAGAIATEAACAAAGGRWRASLFGWMVHVNAFAERESEVFAP